MGYTHLNRVSGIKGIGVGKRGSEIIVADETGQLFQTGAALTPTATQINVLAGVTAGTVAASKAVVVDSNKRADALTIGTLSLGAGVGTAIVPTAAQINLLTQGVDAGYKIARGTVTPTSASHTVVTGLATVVAAVTSLKGAPTLTHLITAGDIGDQAGAPAAGSILINSYKPTSAADGTPIAATTPWGAVDWIAIGT